MTEHNHHRGTRGNKSRRGWLQMAPHYTAFWQRHLHRCRRGLVHKLLKSDKPDDIPGNTPKHIRWDYW